jgi:hypothetical protein
MADQEAKVALPKQQEVESFLPRWYKLFWRWQRIHWVLLIFVTGGSAAVASSAIGDPKYLALAVAVAGAVFTALNPGQRADAYREAWVRLNVAYLKGGNVFDAYEQGEEIIGKRPTPTDTKG